MPTDRRIEAVAAEIAEKYERVGYEVEEFDGPAERPDAEEFYLYVSTEYASFYLTFHTGVPAVTVAYPFTVTRALGRRLGKSERERLVESTRGDGTEPTPEAVGEIVLGRADADTLHEVEFRLADHATVSLVDVEFDRTDDGIPTRFSSYTNVLPYADGFDLQTLDTRTDMAIAAGASGKRFVEHALAVDTDGDPSEYAVELRF